MAEPPTDAEGIAETVGEALRAADHTVATAESATGGLVASNLIAVPGASDYVDRGAVTYSYDAKLEMLGVSRESLDEEGAVSDAVAREMAVGVRDVANVTWGVATTGVAGPTGGDSVPIGTVWIAVAYAAPWGTGESSVTSTRHQFDGDRDTVRNAAARQALVDLHARIETLAESDAAADAS